MGLLRVRFTIRASMIAVAIVGIAIAGHMFWRQSVDYSRKARYSADLEGIARSSAARRRNHLREMRATARDAEASLAEYRNTRAPGDDTDALIQIVDQTRSLAEGEIARTEAGIAEDDRDLEFYGQLREKYDRAARYPWLPVAPDPPEPERGKAPRPDPGRAATSSASDGPTSRRS